MSRQGRERIRTRERRARDCRALAGFRGRDEQVRAAAGGGVGGAGGRRGLQWRRGDGGGEVGDGGRRWPGWSGGGEGFAEEGAAGALLALGASSGTGETAGLRLGSAGVGEVGEGEWREEIAWVGALREERGDADPAGGGVVLGGELGAETGGAVLAEAAGFDGGVRGCGGGDGEGGGEGGQGGRAFGGEVDFQRFVLGLLRAAVFASGTFGRLNGGRCWRVGAFGGLA